MTTHSSPTAEFLGGADAIGASTGNLREAVRQGLPYAALTAVAHSLDVNVDVVLRLIDLSERTHQRRKGKMLTPAESDRLARVARIGAHVTRVLRDRATVRTWLSRPNVALGGERPLDLLDTDLGASEVESVLHRIEYGVFS